MPRNLPTPPPERLQIPGLAGSLGATFELPVDAPRAAVLHLHPLTTHGGTRRNNVVRYGALGSLAAGCAALRIDFRGAGESEGEYDEGRGEIDDAETAFTWLQERVPDVPLFVWGFSFGSRVGLDFAIRRRADVAGYLAVAWPSAIYEWPDAVEWPERMAMLAGDQDDFVDLSRLQPMHDRGASIQIVPGAGHFFPEQLHEVREFTQRTIDGWLAG